MLVKMMLQTSKIQKPGSFLVMKWHVKKGAPKVTKTASISALALLTVVRAQKMHVSKNVFVTQTVVMKYALKIVVESMNQTVLPSVIVSTLVLSMTMIVDTNALAMMSACATKNKQFVLMSVLVMKTVNVNKAVQKDFLLLVILQMLGLRKKWLPVLKIVMSSSETVNNNVKALPPIWNNLNVSHYVFNKVNPTSNFVDNIVT
jgi:hypothetical protein